MELKKRVCNLKLSEKIKELGIECDSLWNHVHFNGNSPDGSDGHYCIISTKELNNSPLGKFEYLYNAYTVAELGELLPCWTNEGDRLVYGTYISIENKKIYDLGLRSEKNKCSCFLYCDDNEANARAKMLIHLLENNLLKNESVQ